MIQLSQQRFWISIALLFALLGWISPVSSAVSQGKRQLVIAQGADVQKFDPHMSTSDTDIKVSFNLFDNLLTRDDQLNLKPALATEWKSLNPTTWQFKLRKGVTFHNGEPFNAETVKFSMGRTLPTGDPKVNTRTTFSTVDRIEVVDAYTVNFITKVPDPLLPDRLAFYGGQIIPKNYFEKVGADEFNRKPIGTGPLKFVEWVKDDHATFEVNRDWWGGQIAFDRVTFKPIPEIAPRLAALLKGEVDIITQLPPDHVERVNKSGTAVAVGVPYAGIYILGTNYRRPFPMDNRDFHQALSLAIDRESIVRDLWRGRGVVPNGVYPQSDWCYDPNLPPLQFNPAKAREMLKKAGYKGEEVVLESTVGYMTNDKEMAEAIISMWRDVGINAKMEVIEYAVRSQKNREKSFKGLWWADPTSTLLDPDGMVWRMMRPGGSYDYIRIPEWDRLMEEASTTLDRAKRKANYDAAHKIFLEYMPWIPVLQPIDTYGIQKYIEWKPRADQVLAIGSIRIK